MWTDGWMEGRTDGQTDMMKLIITFHNLRMRLNQHPYTPQLPFHTNQLFVEMRIHLYIKHP